MKKLIVIAALIVMSSTACFAQLEKGDGFLGLGAVGVGIGTSTSDDQVKAYFSPGMGIGYFLTDDFAFEVGFSEDSDVTALGIGARFKASDYVFLTLSYHSAQASISDSFGNDSSVTASGIGFQLGRDIFLTKVLFLEPTMNGQVVLGDAFGIAMGLSLGFGVKF
jgi:opacity protein-like surface antigen